MQLLQAHVGSCHIRQIATSHMLLKVSKRHLNHLEKLMFVRSGFLNFQTLADHKVVFAHRRIRTVPARSRQFQLAAIACLLQQFPRSSRSRIFAGADSSTRQFQQNGSGPGRNCRTRSTMSCVVSARPGTARAARLVHIGEDGGAEGWAAPLAHG
jgi:hypothetical protein